MNPKLIASALAGTALSLSVAVFAQSNADRGGEAVQQAGSSPSFTHGESKRCEGMTGSAKEQCDKEEATKTEGRDATSAAGEGRSTSSSAAAGESDRQFTHGESKHCETLTGAAKEECDKKEATK